MDELTRLEAPKKALVKVHQHILLPPVQRILNQVHISSALHPIFTGSRTSRDFASGPRTALSRCINPSARGRRARQSGAASFVMNSRRRKALAYARPPIARREVEIEGRGPRGQPRLIAACPFNGSVPTGR